MFHKKHLFTIHVCVVILYYSIVLVVDVGVDVGIDVGIDTGVGTSVLILL